MCKQEPQLRANKNTNKTTQGFKWFTPNWATSTILAYVSYCFFQKFSNGDVHLKMITIDEEENRE